MSRLSFLVAMVAIVLFPGCGYSTRPMHSATVTSVYVPMFKSNGFRRDIEFQLTEAVVKEIEKTTNYKVVSREEADTVLEGTITTTRKRVTVQSPFDEPRQIEATLFVDLVWKDLRTGEVLSTGQSPGVARGGLPIRQTAEYSPELGQSISTAHQEVIEKLARQTVSLMEAGW